MGWLSNIVQWFRPQPQPPTPPAPAPEPNEKMTAELLRLHNLERGRRGLPLLIGEPSCQCAAQLHADVQARLRIMAHSGLGDGNAGSRLTAQEYVWSAVAENVAEGPKDAASVVNLWVGSPLHLINILGNYRHFGGAVSLAADGTPFWCCVFASRPGGGS